MIVGDVSRAYMGMRISPMVHTPTAKIQSPLKCVRPPNHSVYTLSSCSE